MGRLNFKKLGLSFVLLGLVCFWASGVWGQTLEGFPKVIFTDPYWLQDVIVNMYQWEDPGDVNFENYWGQIDSCGINLDVTYGDEISLNNSFGVKIFNQNLSPVIDDNFPWTDPYSPAPDTATVWLFADGQEATYDVGIEEGSRFDYPPATGGQYWDPDPQPGHYVYRALVAQDTAGPLLDGTFLRYDQGRRRPYYVTFRMKMVGDNTQHTEVATVKMWCEWVGKSDEDSPHSQLFYLEPDTGVAKTEVVTKSIYADDFQSPGSYEDLTLPDWVILEDRRYETHLILEWLDERDLYIDNVFIRDVYYYYAFEYNGGGYYDQTIKDSLLAIHNINPALNFHWYKDEPRPTMLRSYTYVDSLAREAGTVPLNGAFYFVDDFNYFIQTLEPDELLFDRYTIYPNTDSASVGIHSIQKSWDKLIWGMRPAILAANGDPDNPNDDIPFWMFIQTFEYWYYGVKQYRNPTPNELKAEIYLSLCYGTKGIVYVVYPTIDYRKYIGNAGGRFGGLVDLVDAEGNPTSDPTIGHFVPNYKWYVVRDMNAILDSLNPVIQGLTWVDAGPWDEVSTLSGSYITSITSEQFPDTSVYVEVGLFHDDLYDYFMLVNRRCLSTETQTVTATLQLSQGECYTIKEMYSGDETVLFNQSGTVNFTTTLGPGQGKLFRLRQGAYLTTHHTWSGTDTIHCDITIASSGALTIQPGTTLKFASGTKLTVEGLLAAEGTASDSITFTSSASNPQMNDWYGIEFPGQASDHSRIRYARILYANTGIYCDHSSPDIDHNLIQSCSYGVKVNATGSIIHDNEFRNNMTGIYCMNSYSPWGSKPQIDCNVFDSSSSPGLLLYASSPFISQSLFKNNGHGVVCWGQSSPNFGYCQMDSNSVEGLLCSHNSSPILYAYPVPPKYPLPGYNHIIGNWKGVECKNSSYPNLGNYNFPGNNSIYDNSIYEIANANRLLRPVYAMYNWWNDPEGPDPSKFYREVIWWPWLEEPPGGGKLLAGEGGGGSPPDSSSNPADYYNRLGGWYRSQRLYEEAIQAFEYVISHYPESQHAQYALHFIILCWRDWGKEPQIVPYLENVAREYPDTDLRRYALEQSVPYLQRAGEYQKALGRCIYLRGNFQDEEMEKSLLFQMGVILRYGLKDDAGAKEMFRKFVQTYPEDILTPIAQLELGDLPSPPPPKQINQQGTAGLPDKFSLFQNYPNPFNPITEIKYALPEDCWVNLEIYNILGQRVVTLVNGKQVAGYKVAKWDASPLVSGIYFYRLQAGNFTQTKKMILLK